MPVEIRELIVRATVTESPRTEPQHNGESILSPEMVDLIVRQVLERIREMEKSRKER